MNKKGKFISFEGIDGAGKSIHLNWAKNWLIQKKINVIVVREPGSTPLGENLRELLFHETMRPLTETLLMFSARHELVEKIIKPALNQGEWVISDRFVDASYAYQGGGREIPLEIIDWLKNKTLNGIIPDLTFLFTTSVSTAEKRRQKLEVNKLGLDRFEKEDNQFFNKVHNAYLECQKREPQRIININAERDIKFIREELTKWLEFQVG